jgi:NADP-dependent alcohol dehydrogenase
LAIVMPRLWENQFDHKKEKLAQYGKRVWYLTGSDTEIARSVIEKTEQFFQSLGVDTKLSAYTADTDHVAEIVRKRFVERGWIAMGERQAIGLNDVEAIVNQSI